jgi:signal transduction histidine kinase/ligand-binding sensor domain-containing protein/DNA-binding response OmpR family regulator
MRIRFTWAFGVAAVLSLNNFLLAQPSEVSQKNIIFQQLPENLSLSQNSINCVLQDREGYLWIGTWSGLIRYDGYSTKVFYSGNGADDIRSNKITIIYEDREGYLWIGTHQGGLFRYEKSTNKFRHFAHQSENKGSLSNNNIWSIQEDHLGNLWIGTEHGLNVLKQGSHTFDKFFHSPDDPASLSQDFITDIFLSSSQELWVSTENGMNKVQVNTGADTTYSFKKYIFREDPVNANLHNYIYQIGELKLRGQSSIWFSTKRGLKKLQGERLQNYMVEDKPASFSFFRSLLTVAGSHPYILTGSETGLNFFDPNTNTFTRFLGNYDEHVNLSHNTITALYFDHGGVLWVGTKKGLNKFDSYANDFQSYSTSLFDPTKSIITGLGIAADGGYWISTIGGGLFKFRDGQFAQYRIAYGRENNFVDFVQTLLTDGKGNVWVGTAGSGVIHFHENDLQPGSEQITRFNHFDERTTPALSDDYIMSFEEDVHGNIWVGTWSGGLNKITPDYQVHQIVDPLLNKAPIVTMHADRDNTLWVGSRGNGLYKIDIGEHILIRQFVHQEKDRESITNNFINTIFEDKKGSLWIGTEDGLNELDRRSGTFSTLKAAEGLSNRVIVSVLDDSQGRLWIAHWNGLTVIDPDHPGFVKNYDEHDRILGGFFYNDVCFKDSRGRLLFGGSDGFNLINPSQIVHYPGRPRVVISDFQIFNKSIVYGEELSGRTVLDKPLAEMDEIVLKHDENSIAFEFTALDFAAPEKTQYGYMLEGFDPGMNYIDASRRYANYTNLGPGEYTFKVKATNHDGAWNESVSQVKLVIRPPWWQTTWAFVLYVIAFIWVLYLFRKFILMRANLLHDLKLERVQRENMEKLNQAKLQFFTNISHEFRTPLTLILGPVQNLLDAETNGKFFRDQMLLINNNAQRLLRLVNQLLDFRKAESGNMKLEVSEGNFVKFVKEIKLSFDVLAEKMNIDFSFGSSAHIIKLWFDRDQFEKILFNLLSNAFKHTPEQGKVSITIEEKTNEVVLHISDTGKGIKGEHVDSIFQTFFSYDEDKHHASTGIGLALAKSLVEMHHGTIGVVSKENEFTRFEITLRKGVSHFDESELVYEGKDSEDIRNYSLLHEEKVSFLQHETIPGNTELPSMLIVEDNDEVRQFVKSVFAGQYTILEASNGKDGLAIAREEMPDIMISDVMMPVMDGIALCKAIKSDVKTSHIPVVLLTARTSLIFKVEGLETGADDYVTKPFNPKVLQLKVKNIVRMRQVLQKLFQNHEVLNIEPKRVVLTSADELFVKQSLESIENNIGNTDYAVEDLSRDVGMSRTQLYRKLKALTGQSANEFIRTIRLKRAAQLLEQNQLTVAEVTYEVGFSDLQHFRECFKKLFGVTPSEYAQKASDERVVE